MLKSYKNKHAETNAITLKFGQFLPIKNITFWVKIGSKNAQDEVRPAVTPPLTQVRIEHDFPLPMILMGEPLANYVKPLDCRCEARTKTGNELQQLLFSFILRKKFRKKDPCFVDRSV
jgi:hypothetical protein